MVDRIKAVFPKLGSGSFRITSPRDADYNWIAWAAGITNDWWWPVAADVEAYWPAGVPRVRTLAAFRAAFESLAYVICSGDELETGFEKVALFANLLGLPTHAARQLGTGRWTSKLNLAEDIEHALRDLEGDIYGSVVLVMKRPLPVPSEGNQPE